MANTIPITEARIKYEDGQISEIQVLVPDGESYRAYCAKRGKLSGYYSLNDSNKASIEIMIDNTARFGLKISAVHYFPNYFQK